MTQQERDDLLILEDWNRNHRIVDGVEEDIKDLEWINGKWQKKEGK